MIKQELSHHMEVKKQLAAGLELLTSLEAAAGPKMQNQDGAPLAAEIADVSAKVSELETVISRSEAAVLDYIAGIKDSRVRQIFHLRFIRGMTWKEVAAAVGWITESGAKAVCYRYIARGGPARMGRPPKKR